MRLIEHQIQFAKDLVKLHIKIYELGLVYTCGEQWRTPEMAEIYAKQGKGIRDSQHCKRLAEDVNLIKDVNGSYTYLTDTENYEELGIYWKSLDPLNRWGGDFHDSHGNPKPDPYHFERFDG